MAFFAPSSSPQQPTHSKILILEPSSPAYPSRIDDASFLSTDLDLSFASVSVTSEPNSPTEEDIFSPSSCDASPAPPVAAAMDISPAPVRLTNTIKSQPTRSRSKTIGQLNIPRDSSNERLFGRELSNQPTGSSPPLFPKAVKGKAAPLPIPPLFERSATAKATTSRQRSGLPTLWTQQNKPTPTASATATLRAKRVGSIFAASAIGDSSPDVSLCSDSMEIDPPSAQKPIARMDAFVTSSPANPLAGGEADFGSLFFDSASPVVNHKKRRSADIDLDDSEAEQRAHSRRSSGGSTDVPESIREEVSLTSSPPASPISAKPAPRLLERLNTTGGHGSLFGASKRAPIPKRPGISALLPSATGESASTTGTVKSAYGGIYGPGGRRLPSSLACNPAPRRTMSCMDSKHPKGRSVDLSKLMFDSLGGDDEDEETEPEDAVDGSSPAANRAVRNRLGIAAGRAASYVFPPSKKGGLAPQKSMMETLAECMGATGPVKASATEEDAVGLGYRECESHGKILPCHAVKDDGLMRITPDTLESLLSGDYDDRMQEFYVIDCRFDYEYEGGHIEGAINLNSDEAINTFFFKDVQPPVPAQSGDEEINGEKRTVIVFHCEFSAKRAPTFAKQFRSTDRKMNLDKYPKVHYPEVYILQGGYKGYYDRHAVRCTGYVPMDAPEHIRARHEHLNKFRRWDRTKSYTYGEPMGTLQGAQASAAASRPPMRPTSATAAMIQSAADQSVELDVVEEHHEDSSFTSVTDSPCSGAARKLKFGGGGSVKISSTSTTKRPGFAGFAGFGARPSLDRAATLGPSTFRLGR
ncbi:cell division cycle- protein [Tulasnella sp. 419]|nr:cell division cycle- protein [Tulasnella sp. 419]